MLDAETYRPDLCIGSQLKSPTTYIEEEAGKLGKLRLREGKEACYLIEHTTSERSIRCKGI